MKNIAVFVIVLLVIISTIFITGRFLTGTGSVFENPQDNEFLERFMSQSKRVAISKPETTMWERGDGGIFGLAIKNPTSEPQTYFITIITDAVTLKNPAFEQQVQAQAPSWVSYSRIISLDPSTGKLFDLTVRPQNPPEGAYLMKAYVCTTEPCTDIASDNYYASITFGFQIT